VVEITAFIYPVEAIEVDAEYGPILGRLPYSIFLGLHHLDRNFKMHCFFSGATRDGQYFCRSQSEIGRNWSKKFLLGASSTRTTRRQITE
jgi:hypothetical protein